MRIHRLEISAFGPFAGTEHIDFDRLSAHGLFLLNGPTGAGKTSVLDAICFALYGSVPGARQDGKRLRSDHAPAAAEPRASSPSSTRTPPTSRPTWSCNTTPPRPEIIASWLKQKRGRQGDARRAATLGEKRDLVEMVARNATDCLDQIRAALAER